MTGYVAVTVNSLPLLFNITGNSSYCSGGSGSVIGLSSTVTGTNYQLYHVGSPLGSAVAGTGTIINFGLQTDTGLYTVVATNTTTGCVGDMSGSISMSVNPLPAGYTFTGGGSYCAGDSGLHVGLSGSDVGVNYRLFRDGNTVGSLVAGTGSAIDLGLQTSESVYTVRATNATTSCYSDLPGSVSIDIPSLYAGTISGASPINDSDTITLSETVSGGAWSSSDTSIVTVNATTGVVTGVSSGYANVFYTITNMCGTGTTVVTIHDLGSHRPANDNSDPLPAADEAMQTWPNPTQGNLFVKVSSGTAKEAHVVVSNVIGEIVKDVMLETNIATGITIGSVPGIYFLTATAGTNKYSTRIEVAGR